MKISKQQIALDGWLFALERIWMSQAHPHTYQQYHPSKKLDSPPQGVGAILRAKSDNNRG